MSEEATRTAVKDLYASYVAHDFSRVAALLADDIDWIIYAPMHIFPFAGHRTGKGAVLEALGGIEQDYSIESYVPKVMIAEDDWASVMSDVAFKQRSTGRLLRFNIADFMRVREGQIVEFREFANTFDVVEQALGRELPI
jgi:ketosteroid isomerase-like protein